MYEKITYSSGAYDRSSSDVFIMAGLIKSITSWPSGSRRKFCDICGISSGVCSKILNPSIGPLQNDSKFFKFKPSEMPKLIWDPDVITRRG